MSYPHPPPDITDAVAAVVAAAGEVAEDEEPSLSWSEHEDDDEVRYSVQKRNE